MTKRSVDAEASTSPTLIAYVVAPPAGMDLVPAWASRRWMDATRERFSNRCLPLRVANQAGWFITNDETVRVVWNGGNDPQDVKLRFDGEPRPHRATSHFGHGIVTWRLPFLFRTPPGYDLLVRGPANWPKEGAYALEGIVETDWAVASFTMNWKVTSADTPVDFPAGEPIAMVVPQRRGELEEFVPSIVDVWADAELAADYHTWFSGRERFLQDLNVPGSVASAARWQRHYMLGTTADGRPAPEHRMRLNLRAPIHVTERAGIDDRKAEKMEQQPFGADEIDVINRVMRHYPAIAGVIRLVQGLSGAVAYPIEGPLDPIRPSTTPEVAFRGRTYSPETVLNAFPEHYFPIVSEDDLIAKVADLAAREPDLAAREPDLSPLSRETAWGEQLDVLPPGVERPDLGAIEIPASPGVAHALGFERTPGAPMSPKPLPRGSPPSSNGRKE